MVHSKAELQNIFGKWLKNDYRSFRTNLDILDNSTNPTEVGIAMYSITCLILKQHSASYYCDFMEMLMKSKPDLLNNFSRIPSHMFYCCDWLKEITLPKHIHNIGTAAFSWCENLKNINTDNITQIDVQAFAYCNELSEITLPKDLEYIETEAFFDSDIRIIHFAGTKKEWEAIVAQQPNWNNSSAIEEIECSDGSIDFRI